MTLNAKDVEAALDARFEGEIEDESCLESWDELAWAVKDEKGETLTVNGEKYPLTVVEEDTGGEGHGEYVFVVIRVGDQLFRKEGYYASHYGTDWDGTFEEVEAFQKKVTDYRKV